MDQALHEAKTERNSNDIQQLALQVTKIATIVENSEKRHVDDMATIRDAVAGINKLNEKVTQTLLLEEKVSNTVSDVRVLKHDMSNLQNGMQSIPLMDSRITENKTAVAALSTKVELLEKTNDRRDGAKEAITTGAKLIWAVAGGGITAVLGWLIIHFVRG